MIPADKFENALRALNQVLIVARSMAYDEVDHKEIAQVLDAAEYLPQLLAKDGDQTSAFRNSLADLAARWPAFNTALEYFDDPKLEWFGRGAWK